MEKENITIKYIKDMMKMQIKIKPNDEYREIFKLPVKAYDDDACFDCYAYNIEYKKDENIVVYDLGFSCEPPQDYHIAIYPRSSVYKTGLVLCNSRGTIDNSYRGTVKAFFYVLKDGEQFKPYEIGDRVCQMRLVKDENVKVVLSGKLTETVRGNGGFGSSGLK
jgi:dUTP pyrophosphatase